MDLFEVRMQFLSNLRKLDATQGSVRKAVGFAVKYFSKCGEDLWDCVLEECQKGSLNMRINILYFLDSLCEAAVHYQMNSAAYQATSGSGRKPTSYLEYVSRDLDQIVQLVVPDSRDGLVNLASAKQMLESWRAKRVLEASVVDKVVDMLDQRREHLHAQPVEPRTSPSTEFSKDEILRRFEEDRERHKLLRQKRWFLPIPTQTTAHQQPKLATTLLIASTLNTTQPNSAALTPSSVSPASPSQTRREAFGLPNQGQPQQQQQGAELALDIEFEQAWETTSDWNEDDDEIADEENGLCFPPPPALAPVPAIEPLLPPVRAPMMAQEPSYWRDRERDRDRDVDMRSPRDRSSYRHQSQHQPQDKWAWSRDRRISRGSEQMDMS